MSLKSGLVSVTFRKLPVAEIIQLVAATGLDGIEWGGDHHVPHGKLKIAQETFQQTTDAGLKVAAYGSYYRFDGTLEFESVLATAVELKAPVIRVWAGTKGSQDTTTAERDYIVDKARAIGDLAATANIKVAFEYHGKTLTDQVDSTVSLLTEIDHPNIYTYWQPLDSHTYSEQMRGLLAVKPWLVNIHVYHWTYNGHRLPLLAGTRQWTEFIRFLKTESLDPYLLLEFVRNDNTEQFKIDAQNLKKLMS